MNLLPEINQRRSSRAFAPRALEAETLAAIFEAARWAPSSSNMQPWRFLVTTKEAQPEAYQKLFNTLVPANMQWAGEAPVLILVCAHILNPKGNPNRFALYDTGQAVGMLLAQATHSGLNMRQMGGFDQQAAREAFAIPTDHEVVCVMAIGYPGDAEALPEPLRERETAPRTRKPTEETVSGGSGRVEPFLTKIISHT